MTKATETKECKIRREERSDIYNWREGGRDGVEGHRGVKEDKREMGSLEWEISKGVKRIRVAGVKGGSWRNMYTIDGGVMRRDIT